MSTNELLGQALRLTVLAANAKRVLNVAVAAFVIDGSPKTAAERTEIRPLGRNWPTATDRNRVK